MSNTKFSPAQPYCRSDIRYVQLQMLMYGERVRSKYFYVLFTYKWNEKKINGMWIVGPFCAISAKWNSRTGSGRRATMKRSRSGDSSNNNHTRKNSTRAKYQQTLLAERLCALCIYGQKCLRITHYKTCCNMLSIKMYSSLDFAACALLRNENESSMFTHGARAMQKS